MFELKPFTFQKWSDNIFKPLLAQGVVIIFKKCAQFQARCVVMLVGFWSLTCTIETLSSQSAIDLKMSSHAFSPSQAPSILPLGVTSTS